MSAQDGARRRARNPGKGPQDHFSPVGETEPHRAVAGHAPLGDELQGCGKSHAEEHEVSGHGFSRAATAATN
jgi:hypothetical protein